jgi:predicted transcriptional regulator
MVAVILDQDHERRLQELAAARGQDAAALAGQVLSDYLDFQSLPADTDDQWAEVSVRLVPEFMGSEQWD